ncbi:MAG TPA: glycosyltransferase family 4 protein [Patescibacteria group bacterium]|nr:glycosyltransferase family 4 protein [Patescibacteria group bacterium]
METKKIKVAFLSFYSGKVYRGVETYVHELANRLIDLDVDVTVYQNGDKLPNSKYKVNSSKLKINWKIPFKNFYWNILLGKHVIRVLRNIDADIIVATNGSTQTLLVKLWCLINNKKIIIPGQSGPGGDDKFNLICFPNCFIALTNWQKGWAKKINPFVKTEVIPNGVDLKKFNKNIKPIQINLPKPIVLNVGALVEEKRQDLIIKAVSKTNASLLIVGKGNKEEELRKLGDKLLPGRFKIVSFSHEKMPEVYTSCDLFTYPTVSWESFGIVMVEAMASGLPVVANNDPIRREIVGNAGYFVDPINTEEYAKVLDQGLKTKWGSAPRKQAEKFSWDEIAKKYKDIIEEL